MRTRHKMASHVTPELINVARQRSPSGVLEGGLRANAKLVVPSISAWPKHFATEVTDRGKPRICHEHTILMQEPTALRRGRARRARPAGREPARKLAANISPTKSRNQRKQPEGPQNSGGGSRPGQCHGQFIVNRASLAWSKSFAIESPAIAQLAAIVVAGAP